MGGSAIYFVKNLQSILLDQKCPAVMQKEPGVKLMKGKR